MSIAIGRAETSDVERVLRLLNDAARWLHDKGVRQWDAGQWERARLRDAIARGETYLAYDRGVVVGTVNVSGEDARTWPEGGAALYVHRLAVARAAHGRGVGTELLAWAERTARARGARALRLDCACDNGRLRAYYERQGYVLRDERVAGTWCAARYEKRIA